jgi:hypothetical protein
MQRDTPTSPNLGDDLMNKGTLLMYNRRKHPHKLIPLFKIFGKRFSLHIEREN